MSLSFICVKSCVKPSVKLVVKSSVHSSIVYLDGKCRDLPSENAISLRSARCLRAVITVCLDMRSSSQILVVEHTKGIFQNRLLHSLIR